jgi:hypothetical protein
MLLGRLSKVIAATLELQFPSGRVAAFVELVRVCSGAKSLKTVRSSINDDPRALRELCATSGRIYTPGTSCQL